MDPKTVPLQMLEVIQNVILLITKTKKKKKKLNSMALVRKQTIPTERLPLVGKISGL
jgi:hypothetical protein